MGDGRGSEEIILSLPSEIIHDHVIVSPNVSSKQSKML